MIGNTAITKSFFNQSCLERIENGQTIYVPIANLIATVPDGAKIPTNEQVQPLDQTLFDANQDIVSEDLDLFRSEVKKLLESKA